VKIHNRPGFCEMFNILINENLLLMKNLYLLLLILSSLAVNAKTITGTVTDEESYPLPGVNIIIKGSQTGTQTDFDGKYSLEAKEGDILVFSYLGFKTQEKKVKKGTVLNVVLKADNVSLNEVVMVRQMEVSSQAMMMMAPPPPGSESY